MQGLEKLITLQNEEVTDIVNLYESYFSETNSEKDHKKDESEDDLEYMMKRLKFKREGSVSGLLEIYKHTSVLVYLIKLRLTSNEESYKEIGYKKALEYHEAELKKIQEYFCKMNNERFNKSL